MTRPAKILMAAPLAAALFLLAACDESEQDRILYYEKGEYQGPSDSPLPEEKVDELRSRALLQQGA